MGMAINITTTSTHLMKREVKGLLLAVASVCLSACTVVPGFDLGLSVTSQNLPSEIGGYDLVKVTPDVLSVDGNNDFGSKEIIPEPVLGGDSHVYEYKVGKGDVLTIIVWDHPELTSPTGEFRDPESSGRLVGPNGKIFYPYVGELYVEGLTVSTIRRLIAARLARVVRDPQVDVRVASFRSQRVRVTGEVSQPTIVSITDRGLTVSEALAIAGGPSEAGSKRYVYLIRGGERYRLDVYARRSSLAPSDIALQASDLLIVPEASEESIYVFGAVNKQAIVPLPYGEISLAEALASVDGLNQATADRRRIFIVRRKNSEAVKHDRLVVYHIDLKEIQSLILAENFILRPQDVVYVDRTGLASYNTVVQQILPTVSTLFQLDRLVNQD